MIDKDTVYGRLGFNLSKARKDKNLSQEELAKKMGLSRASIANYESARQQIPLYEIYKMSEILGVRLEQLIPSVDEVKSLGSPENQLKRDKTLSDEQRQDIEEFIKRPAGDKGK